MILWARTRKHLDQFEGELRDVIRGHAHGIVWKRGEVLLTPFPSIINIEFLFLEFWKMFCKETIGDVLLFCSIYGP